ncbi:hypothetical protein QTP86_019024, partial [Hemibagrus guttatus]
MSNYSSMKLEFLVLKWAMTEKFRVPVGMAVPVPLQQVLEAASVEVKQAMITPFPVCSLGAFLFIAGNRSCFSGFAILEAEDSSWARRASADVRYGFDLYANGIVLWRRM